MALDIVWKHFTVQLCKSHACKRFGLRSGMKRDMTWASAVIAAELLISLASVVDFAMYFMA